MRRYERYKDSGVEWLGEVPSHWESFPLFVQAKISSITNHIDKELLSVYLDRGVVKFSDVDEKRTNVTSLDLSKYQLVRKGNLVLNNQQAWRGSVGVSSYEGIVSPAYLILELSNKFDPHYANYLFRNGSMVSHYLIASKGVGTIQRNLYWGNLRRTPIFIPPLSEQQKIAQFLDDKIAKIDQAVDLAEKQIALLKEHKQILIQNAVTRGLNPDVPLKDSGVEWIGQVPEHWDVKKLKYLAKLSPSKSEITCNHEESCSFIPMEKLKLNTLILDEIKQIKNVYSAYTYFRDEDLLIAKVTPCFENKNFAIAKNLVNSIGFGSSEIYVLRAYNNLFNKFLFYRLQEQNFMEIAISKMSGTGGLKRVPSEFINNFQLALPPLCEQQKIADYLDTQTAKIGQAIALKTAHIEKLKEYKSVLINDVVTGKVRVSV